MILLAVVLFASVANAQTNEAQSSNINSTKIQSSKEEISTTLADIRELFKNEFWIYTCDDKNVTGGRSYSMAGTQKNILILEDRIEYNFNDEKTIIYISDLIDCNFQLYSFSKQRGLGFDRDFIVYSKAKKVVAKLYEDFIFIQKQLKENPYYAELALFEPLALQYRALTVKPAVSEAQRRYIVQANSFNQQKTYYKAIELYSKAVELDPTAYPAAYSNLALLSAQIGKYNTAIYQMKKYLLLEPESADARSAQDKIYEWEIMMQE
jgi:tetratricopeptide (TPR) repeat protein